MATVSDDRFASLRGQGFTGATSDMLLQWLQANGATAKTIPDAWREMLIGLGFDPYQRSDAWRDYLLSIAPPETGSALPDLNEWFWKPVGEGGAGGIIGGGGGALPAWAAASSEYMVTGSGSHEFLAQLEGTGAPTFDTPAGLLLPDYEGVYKEIPEDTMPVHGARKVTNVNPYSEPLVLPEL